MTQSQRDAEGEGKHSYSRSENIPLVVDLDGTLLHTVETQVRDAFHRLRGRGVA